MNANLNLQSLTLSFLVHHILPCETARLGAYFYSRRFYFYEYGNWGNVPGDDEPMFESRTRTEIVPGAFFEYTWTPLERLVVVAGLRGDHHNLYGNFASPRLHVRYSLAEETSIKLVAGRGFRTANVFMEQLGSWASNRRWDIQEDLAPEVATNVGVNLISKFRLNSRAASISLDGYFTNFDNRIVVDLYNSPQEVSIYNLNNSGGYQSRSSSTTVQLEFDWSLHRRLDIRAAYRWVNAVTGYASGDFDAENGFEMQQDPYVSIHRAFTQLSYASKASKDGQQTRIDATVQWVGPQALPIPGAMEMEMVPGEPMEPMQNMHPSISPSFAQVNLQLTQVLPGNLELYIGVENMTNVMQMSPIAGVNEGVLNLENFDASLIYGPIMGRLSYAGVRWTLGSQIKGQKLAVHGFYNPVSFDDFSFEIKKFLPARIDIDVASIFSGKLQESGVVMGL